MWTNTTENTSKINILPDCSLTVIRYMATQQKMLKQNTNDVVSFSQRVSGTPLHLVQQQDTFIDQC